MSSLTTLAPLIEGDNGCGENSNRCDGFPRTVNDET